jgi:CRP-like cAMP-binding protein
MTQHEIIQQIQQHITLTREETEQFLKIPEVQKLNKNAFLIRQGDAACPLVLIKTGCLMTYYTDAKRNIHVIQFGKEMWWTGDLDSFANGKPTQYSIKAITPAEVFLFNLSQFNHLCETIPAFTKYFRNIFMNSLVSHQKRIIRNIANTAADNYQAFQQQYPGLELLVAQKYIASFLGITPEFLSKIRTRLSKSERLS